MKKFSPRRFLLILLPSLIVFGLVTKAMFFPSPGYSAQVTKVPPANGKTYQRDEIDTKIVVTFGYGPFRELRNRLSRKGSLPAVEWWQFRDGDHNNLSPSRSAGRNTGSVKISSGTYATTYEFSMRDLPKSAKNVMFHTSVSDGNGWTLPISVPLKR